MTTFSRWLELKIPPVALLAMTGLAMWAGDLLLPALSLPMPATVRWIVAPGLALCGASISVAGILAFHRAGTTVNPLTPESVTSFVVDGIYRHSRNPMYLGFLLALVGLAVFLGNALATILPVLFVLYMNRFQIAPEERFLGVRFGTAYRTYCDSVPRWI